MATVNFADYKNIWVFAEQRGGKLMNVALELIGEGHRLARDIGNDCKVCAVLVGNGIGGLSKDCLLYTSELLRSSCFRAISGRDDLRRNSFGQKNRRKPASFYFAS